jgi:hypothetical protein
MLLSDDRNLPMPLQKTQISTISFGHSVGTGRTGVRPAPDVPRGCPPQSFLRQEGPANPSAANFPQSAVLRLLPIPTLHQLPVAVVGLDHVRGPSAPGWSAGANDPTKILSKAQIRQGADRASWRSLSGDVSWMWCPARSPRAARTAPVESPSSSPCRCRFFRRGRVAAHRAGRPG